MVTVLAIFTVCYAWWILQDEAPGPRAAKLFDIGVLIALVLAVGSAVYAIHQSGKHEAERDYYCSEVAQWQATRGHAGLPLEYAEGYDCDRSS